MRYDIVALRRHPRHYARFRTPTEEATVTPHDRSQKAYSAGRGFISPAPPSGLTRPTTTAAGTATEDEDTTDEDLANHIGHQVGAGIGYGVGHALAQHYGGMVTESLNAVQQDLQQDLPDRIVDAHERRTAPSWWQGWAAAGASSVDNDWRMAKTPQIARPRKPRATPRRGEQFDGI